MYLYQYILMAGFVCLLFNKETRFPASVFLVGWLIYIYFFLDATSNYKYVGCATIELIIAYTLNKNYRIVSYLGYSLIAVNLYGLLLIKNQSPPFQYDILYALISVVQFLLLLLRANLNGINRLHTKHFMVSILNCDSRRESDIMRKNKKAEGIYK